MNSALLIIDIQNDFVPGGALAVPEGEQIIPLVNDLQTKFDYVYATQDWHPAGHASFASSHKGREPFESIRWKGTEQTLWPDHCVQGTAGARFDPDLDTRRIQAIFRKGMDPDIDSYSGFYDNGHKRSTGLSGFLKGLGIGHMHFCGLAADYCVYFSIKDALHEGFKCTLHTQATRAIDVKAFARIRVELEEKGVELV